MSKAKSRVQEILSSEEVDEVLGKSFYKKTTEPLSSREPSPKRSNTSKADHYEIICISLYNEDLKRLDDKVGNLKAAGHRKMSRSALIRFALDTVDMAKLPRAY
ncbi:MAG: hypothetical protein H6714_09655 [Myxococcales bacterium]|nr:hypothetical protein [Myxococcales bacterium]